MNLKLTLILAFAITFASCSKDKKIERKLPKGDGIWNITSAAYVFTEQDVNDVNISQAISSGTKSNIGSFTFGKDGIGSFSFTIDSFTREGSFTWMVVEEEVSIVYTYINLADIFSGTGDYDQVVGAFSGIWEKNSWTLNGGDVEQHFDGTGNMDVTQTVLAGTFELSN